MFSRVFSILTVLLHLLGANPRESFAAKRAPKPQNTDLEVYTAISDGTFPVYLSGDTSVDLPNPPKPPSSPVPPPVATKPSERAWYVDPPPVPYDEVPTQHIDSIAGRLMLVETLLREFGRAYDYRTLTSQQLRELLTSLRSNRDKS